MEIRHAVSTDIAALMAMDHSYQTDHVWQMALSPSPTETTIAFSAGWISPIKTTV